MWTEESDRNAPGDSPVRFTDSECEECSEEDPACWNCKILGGKNSSKKPSTLFELKEKCKAVMGALHGQTITAYSYMQFYKEQVQTSPDFPFNVGRIYKICFKLDDSKAIPWCITSIYDVTLNVESLPQVFKDWEEGRKQGMVAPYDSSPADREKHEREIQGFLAALKDEQEAMGSATYDMM